MEKEELFDFLNESVTAFHASDCIVTALIEAGFEPLVEEAKWKLEAGGKYFVARNDSAVIAFVLPKHTSAEMSARMVATHLDSPSLRVKLRGVGSMQGTMVLPTEVYGGPILSTWLDRPLGIGGRLVYEEDGRVQARLCSRADVAVVPNAAIHLNHEINTKGAVYNQQRQLNAIIGLENSESLSDYLGIPEIALLDSELYLYDAQGAMSVGMHEELINSSRLDNLLSAYTALRAMMECAPVGETMSIAFWADNEEIGSETMQGAGSNFLAAVYRRILNAFGGSDEDCYVSFAKSTLISADAAHAAHPNYMELYEPHYSPKLGGGVVIKKNARARYATDGRGAAAFRLMCRNANVPCQDFTNRADMPCGSTVGPMLSSALGVSTIDIGVPMLAMHSIRETAAWQDILSLKAAFDAFLR